MALTVDPSKELKCAACRAVFYEARELYSKAGVANGQMHYNMECPNCGTYDRMNEDYVGVPDDVLIDYHNQKINLQDVLDEKTDEKIQEDREAAKHHSEF